MREAGCGLSFCHEGTAEAVDGRAVGTDRALVSPAEAAARQAWAATSGEPGVFRGHFVDSPEWRGLEISARRVSFPLDLLAALATVAGRRRLVGGMARPAGGAG